MLRSYFGLTFILVLISTFPLHSAAQSVGPCNNLTRGLQRLEAENICYRKFLFIPAGLEREGLEEELKAAAGLLHREDLHWSFGCGPTPDFTVLQVWGASAADCFKLADLFKRALQSAGAGQNFPAAWQAEGLLPAGAGDLTETGLGVLEAFQGVLHSAGEYNGTVNLLGYAPRAAGALFLEGAPVNLHIELTVLPSGEGIRVRIGMPFLLTLSHYIE